MKFPHTSFATSRPLKYDEWDITSRSHHRCRDSRPSRSQNSHPGGNRDVHIYEARGRIGGRIHTIPMVSNNSDTR